jgi:uncharacterized protein (UPF0332 family)
VSPTNVTANVLDELAHSAEAMRAAEALLDLGLHRDAINRLYYALYHATLALLLTEGLEPSTHGGVLSMLGLHFIKAGRMPAAFGVTLKRIQGYREAADYTRGFEMPEEEARQEFAAGRDYLVRARAVLAGLGYLEE